MEENFIEINHIFNFIDELGHKALKDEWIYYPETDIYQKPEYVDPVAISYKIAKRTYAEGITARKPIYKENDHENKQVIKGQMFDTIVEFGIWGKSYDEVSNTREWLEKFLMRHIKSFKEKGVLKFLFEGQLEDTVVKINDNSFTVQRLHFFIRNKRLIKVPYSLIENIDVNVKSFDNIRETQNFY